VTRQIDLHPSFRSTHCVNHCSVVFSLNLISQLTLDSPSSTSTSSSCSSSCSCYLVILQLITYSVQYLQLFSLLCHDQYPTFLCNRHFVCTYGLSVRTSSTVRTKSSERRSTTHDTAYSQAHCNRNNARTLTLVRYFPVQYYAAHHTHCIADRARCDMRCDVRCADKDQRSHERTGRYAKL
jgi:hypothetical protein